MLMRSPITSITLTLLRHNSMYAASTRSMASPLHQPPYKLQDVSGASEVCKLYLEIIKSLMVCESFLILLLFVLRFDQ